MASNLAELKAVIDTHKSGLGIGADPTYKTAAGGSLSKPSAVVYLNTGSLLKAARGLLNSPRQPPSTTRRSPMRSRSKPS